jgi:hypothetical protein
MSTIQEWERMIDEVTVELRALSNKSVLYAVCDSILTKAAVQVLDPLQLATVDEINSAIVKALLGLRPRISGSNNSDPDGFKNALTDLIDEITDRQLSLVEKLQSVLSKYNENEDLNETLDYLIYQYAAMVRRLYSRLSSSLPGSYDHSTEAEQYRVQSWVMPVYARLQRRFPKFSEIYIEEKSEELYSLSYNKLINQRLSFHLTVTPYYTGVTSSVNNHSSVNDIITSTTTLADYEPWKLAYFITKVFRYTLLTLPVEGLEVKLLLTLREDIALRVQSLATALQDITKRYTSTGSGVVNDSKEDKEALQTVHTIGKEAAAAVLLIWQLRHNLIGVAVPTDNDSGGNAGSNNKPVAKREREFISDLSLSSRSALLPSLPRAIREHLSLDLAQYVVRLQPSPTLETFAFLAFALRTAAGELLRSLVNYNMDMDISTRLNRDKIYSAPLISLLYDTLISDKYNEEELCKGLVVMAVLEEVLACREPRRCCRESYRTALVQAVEYIVHTTSSTTILDNSISSRLSTIEKALCFILRLPEDEVYATRKQAFEEILQRQLQRDNRNGLQAIQQHYIQYASLLNVDLIDAQAYVQPLVVRVFDKTLGNMLIHTDIALFLPDSGNMFLEQLLTLGKSANMSVEEVYNRSKFIVAAVLSTILRTALEESGDSASVMLALQKAYLVHNHPLVVLLNQYFINNDTSGSGNSAGAANEDMMLHTGLRMTIASLDSSLLLELIRLLDTYRNRLSNTQTNKFLDSQTWGGSVGPSLSQTSVDDDQLKAFIMKMQTFLVKEYATGKHTNIF